MPPRHQHLTSIAEQGFSFLRQNFTPIKTAVAAFLFMARSQFFYDANKRTASLMLNGLLIRDGYYPVTVLNEDAAEFHSLLTDFYQSGNATLVMQFWARTIDHLYQSQLQIL